MRLVNAETALGGGRSSMAGMTKVRFRVECRTKWGEEVAVLGSAVGLGEWEPSRALLLTTDPESFPVWSGEMEVDESADPGDKLAEYKYVIVASGKVKKWEHKGPNRILSSSVDSTSDGPIDIVESFGQGVRNQHQTNGSPPAVDASVPIDDRFAVALVHQNSQNKSWRKRLQFIRELFTNEDAARAASFDPSSNNHLVYIVVYMTFLKSGQIRCFEDGSHYRPNHHANEARMIEESLARLVTDENSFLIRKIYPLLPSYKSDFTVSVPLTRIRDIAHRGDIPSELKQDIKHNLQNKLHRSAGPEDLQTSERILRMVTAPDAHYSGGFVEQMQIFHRELLEFFNATGLDDQLVELQRRREPTPEADHILGKFLEKKHAFASVEDQLQELTAARRLFRDALPKISGEVLQRVRLCDIGLEEYAFVLLADVAKKVEARHGGPVYAMEMTSVALENIALSGVGASEMHCLLNENRRITRAAQNDLLARRATWERAARYCGDFSSHVSLLYGCHAEQVGRALGVDEHAVSVFAEAEVRSHLVFQLSRIAASELSTVREALRLPPWDPLCVGTCFGRLQAVANLEQVQGEEPRVLLLEHAHGDEDIPSSVHGIVLGHTIPHLSHLGVRARQAGVVLVCSEEKNTYNSFVADKKALNDENVQLSIDSCGSIRLERSDLKTKGSQGPTGHVRVPDGDVSATRVLPVAKCLKESSGSKAYFAGVLERASRAAPETCRFETPGGLSVPFGHFLRAAKGSPAWRKLHEIQLAFDKLEEPSKIDAVVEEAQDILSGCSPDPELADEVCRHFSLMGSVMVRSSANCEDLEDMSGAGLYDSISNVPSSSADEVSKAISSVWKSLWTKRAALSRKQYKVPHAKAYMGVLIQPMVSAKYSFIMFSQNPVSGKEDQVYIELAVGMGETLASATSRGIPYRAVFDRETEQVQILSYSNYSACLVPDQKSSSGLSKSVIDYSKESLTTDEVFRSGLCKRLGRIAVFLEKHLGCAQDIEGAVVEQRVHIVQTRPMVIKRG